jgi:23S rRNA (pseudouridine1915-N3)-methyltransferase
MRITLICVGRLSREYAAVWGHYQKLVRPYFSLDVFEVAETPLSLGVAQVQAREGASILSLFRTDAFTVTLDRGGRQFTSEELSGFLADRKLHGVSHFQFILGGAVGMDSKVLATADMTWSLAALTFPHQLARVIVLEQLYRALRIERGEPYHH